MLIVVRFGPVPSDFPARAESALRVLAARPGFIHGEIGRSTDTGVDWVLVLSWTSVGAWRRALSSFEVKTEAVPLLSLGLDQPSAYEVLLAHDGDDLRQFGSDLAGDVDQAPGR